jgi:hypothetical protein
MPFVGGKCRSAALANGKSPAWARRYFRACAGRDPTRCRNQSPTDLAGLVCTSKRRMRSSSTIVILLADGP